MSKVTVEKIKSRKENETFGLIVDKDQIGYILDGCSTEGVKQIIAVASRKNNVQSGALAVVSEGGGDPRIMRVCQRDAEPLEILAEIVEVRLVFEGAGGAQ